MVLIKPHHFMDIIKLYGAGIEVFVPAPDYGHDFYRAANQIVGDVNTELTVTVNADDICGPCKYLENGRCLDCIGHIEGVTSKDQYNQMLDQRILAALEMSEGDVCTAGELCRRMMELPELVKLVWKEEDGEGRKRREELFWAGVGKYM